jgi:two-component system sensor histidine kinase AlgZ
MAFSLLKKRLPNWVMPSFFIGTTLLIMVFNDVFGDSDTFEVFSFFFFVALTLASIRFVFNQVKMVLTLKNEKKQTELMHLKSQVNPHFFFNTLNNLYGLVGQDADKAQQLILKLSDMMRYSIYEGQNDVVTLAEEIEYLNNYIELHKMRYHKTIVVQFHIDVEDSSVKLMPLLFIILMENAFKHGVENLRKDAFVTVRLKATKQQIDFEIENNFDPAEQSEHPGIGLANLKRRLELAYDKKHHLATAKAGDVFTAKLSLQI